MLHRQPDDQEVVDFGKRQERRVEERDEEQAGAAQRDARSPEPTRRNAFIDPECRLEAPCVTRRTADPAPGCIAARAACCLARTAPRPLYYAHARPRAQPLRRARAPRRRAAHPRQPDAGLAADRRRLAAAAAPARTCCRSRSTLYRTGASGDRDLGASAWRSAAWALASLIVRAHRLGRRRPGRRGAAHGQPERALPPEHADDRAAALRHDAAGGDADGGVGRRRRAGARRTPPGLALAAACMTRYEAWPIAAAIVVLAALSCCCAAGRRRAAALVACARLAVYPAVAVAALRRSTAAGPSAHWFVSGGFFVAENEAHGQPLAGAGIRCGWGSIGCPARLLVWPAYAGAALVVVAFVASRGARVAGAACSRSPRPRRCPGTRTQGPSVPHPLQRAAGRRVRARSCGAGIGLLPRRARAPVGGRCSSARRAAGTVSPLDRSRADGRRSRSATPRTRPAARAVTAYLRRSTTTARAIMMSMGSLAHYMHDLSRVRLRRPRLPARRQRRALDVRAASTGRAATSSWVAIEEQAEGGDALVSAREARIRSFCDGFERVAEGGGVALYRASDSRRFTR